MIKIIIFPKHDQKAVEKEGNITKNKKSMSTLLPSSADSLVAAHFLKPTVIIMRQEQCSVWLPVSAAVEVDRNLEHIKTWEHKS